MGRWSTDYPFADINFMIRLSEMSTTGVHFDDEDEPIHWVVPVTDDTLFSCPFIIASAVGSMVLTSDDASRLRDYLLKGGFIWVDDFWGSWEWAQWSSQIAKVLPPNEYPIVDLPLDHELFQTLFNIWEIPQIANIGFWRAQRVSDRRPTIGSRTVPNVVQYLGDSTDRQHRLLAPLRWAHIGARRRQRGAAFSCDFRPTRPDHGRDDTQHRHTGRLGA